ncbi:cocaine- and amphetamine-regulated transcript protein [Centrocercus urophasianus]|uniref:cocaine- and amphetamine-regulated transcript protein n=1 Tax=Centrocercus urophasianus TaxID=9002 RepID=UPI001C64FFFF|nr:cocaine- and amphetamine-regulated transcript protein [Centrocercus urophasianus]XP_042738873.1 cocaine- and amphetamine-regulated transcript protein [Lagopus leucura]XP_048788066.1 cocaine- and amphetamine-regulated transcript protein [Lagopus muta]
MESCRALALCAVAAALLLSARGQGPPAPRRDRDLGPHGGGGGGASREKELIEALQEVLEKLKSKRVPHYEKKFGQVPMCDAGEQCAVRKGARIGKLCDCPRGTSCNSFLLKCL